MKQTTETIRSIFSSQRVKRKERSRMYQKTLIAIVMAMFPILCPASGGPGLYGKQHTSTPAASSVTEESRKQTQLPLSSITETIGLFETDSKSALRAAPGGGGNGSHVPIGDGFGVLLLISGVYVFLMQRRVKQSEK
ncbi:MAG: hypothetical protein LBM08_10900 [Dysgonamonadaceae bacterium]|nr:hypothetical protein [Dysgonamonadaceae bacterium]